MPQVFSKIKGPRPEHVGKRLPSVVISLVFKFQMPRGL